MDYTLCWTHLANRKHVFIAKSRHLRTFNHPVQGLGVYAVLDTRVLRSAGKNHGDGGSPVEDAGIPVFAAGDILGVYMGERLTRAEFDRRYGDDETSTAAYSANVDYGADAARPPEGDVMDAIAATNFVSYINEYVDVARIMNQPAMKKNTFVAVYNDREREGATPNVEWYAPSTVDRNYVGPPQIRAMREIHHGEELLIAYGAEYWNTDALKLSLTSRAWPADEGSLDEPRKRKKAPRLGMPKKKKRPAPTAAKKTAKKKAGGVVKRRRSKVRG
jgi:hypothetical protein